MWILSGNRIKMVNVLKGVLIEWWEFSVISAKNLNLQCLEYRQWFCFFVAFSVSGAELEQVNPSTKYNMLKCWMNYVLKFIKMLLNCSDAVLKQFLLHLDETLAFGRKFVLEDLDETHLFISSDIVNTLKEKVWELMDNNSFNVTKLD